MGPYLASKAEKVWKTSEKLSPKGSLCAPWCSFCAPFGLIGRPEGGKRASERPPRVTLRTSQNHRFSLWFSWFLGLGGIPGSSKVAPWGSWWALVGTCGRHRDSKCRFGAPLGGPGCPKGRLGAVDVGGLRHGRARRRGGRLRSPNYAQKINKYLARPATSDEVRRIKGLRPCRRPPPHPQIDGFHDS